MHQSDKPSDGLFCDTFSNYLQIKIIKISLYNKQLMTSAPEKPSLKNPKPLGFVLLLQSEVLLFKVNRKIRLRIALNNTSDLNVSLNALTLKTDLLWFVWLLFMKFIQAVG